MSQELFAGVPTSAMLPSTKRFSHTFRQSVISMGYQSWCYRSHLGQKIDTGERLVNLISIYLATELQSFALYIIAALSRDSLRSVQASLKYFILGA
ncbi:uncharacterized protein MELLADRAFT_86002 [Melampsora larici-populina 98AG31]|uniref:NADH:quinone oxidoreductase/Mrp antiporter transmembrane domain-containing protein n=1 Tax=Melampsora larici-populina (strain 98AG31 / pathotype 3-4-7) TaxID=747676 RepID=F4RKF3_MELLP|nr:uncharacterized protein MELLADRAFT_86002 [Melampsora larici-populina 98AG31]EGG07191.1 hypothetical protein MELLADRAFT_86002 [Melampsora larici-populina 98AG31]